MTVSELLRTPNGQVITPTESDNGKESITPTVYMVDGIVYKWGTQDRTTNGNTVNMEMFDKNTDISPRRIKSLASGTLIVTSREIERRNTGRRVITRNVKPGTVFRR